MVFSELIQRLDRYARIVNRAIIIVGLVEAAIVLIISVLSGHLLNPDDTVNKMAGSFLICLALIYLLFLFIRIFYTANFPGSIANELKSERELSKLRKDSERQREISRYFTITMRNLNGQTCALPIGGDTRLCDSDIKEGMLALLEPIITNTSFLLDTNKTQFTIGLFLSEYRSMEPGVDWENGIIVISDNLNKEQLLKKNLLTDNQVNGEELEIQTAIRFAHNNSRFFKDDYSVNDQRLSIICSPMSTACDETEPLGVIFIITEYLELIPEELSMNLSIFNRVISHWIYRYNECINHRNPLIIP